MSQSPTSRRRPDRTSLESTRVRAEGADAIGTPHVFQAAFQRDSARVAEMRRATALLLQRAGLPKRLAGDVVLAVSELVTNAVVHGEGDVKLWVRVIDGEVRVSVTDKNPSPAVLKDPDSDRESGRGLHLVAALADAWESLGEETWCEFRFGTGRGAA
ncbi:ATP-binding protein [Streptomyces sp. CFMR 7]|uniref:ATP-binding protein n=1 Tax=Streptomyces sp. CFMR 7 TaxID=1649184 RepID=UPI00119DD1B2|nr:ATP-binding protein [Streptomyces sp. CFMR 7]